MWKSNFPSLLSFRSRVCLQKRGFWEKSSMNRMEIPAGFQRSDLLEYHPVVSHSTQTQVHGATWSSPCPPLYHTGHSPWVFSFWKHAELGPIPGPFHLLLPHLQLCSPPDLHSSLLFSIQISAQAHPEITLPTCASKAAHCPALRPHSHIALYFLHGT